MIRSLAAACLFTLALAPGQDATLSAQAAQAAPQAPAPAPAGPIAATPENTANFVGDWTLTGESPNGPFTSDLSIKAQGGKLVSEMSSQTGKQAITDISKNGTALVLSYSFDYQGQAIPTVVTLTPAGEKVTFKMDFANGAFLIEGAATKKK
jgi:hypothetical protein